MEKATAEIVYECIRCGARVPVKELESRGGEVRGEEIKCTVCSCRILKKIRPPVVKRVLAR